MAKLPLHSIVIDDDEFLVALDGHLSTVINTDTHATVRVQVVDGTDSQLMKLSPDSTVQWRDSDISLKDLIAYIDQLEDKLAEAHLTSLED